MTKLAQRMYFFVPYNISEIQKGIQAGHAALEYANTFGHTQEYKDFILNDKTWIILNGGTTRTYTSSFELGMEAGTLDTIRVNLLENYIPHVTFSEPDLNFALTAVCFLADERVWDKEKYPDFDFESKDNLWTLDETDKWAQNVGGEKNIFLRFLLEGKRLA